MTPRRWILGLIGYVIFLCKPKEKPAWVDDIKNPIGRWLVTFFASKQDDTKTLLASRSFLFLLFGLAFSRSYTSSTCVLSSRA